MTFFGSTFPVVDVRALEHARQEKLFAPQLRADNRLAGTEDDEAGEVLVDAAAQAGRASTSRSSGCGSAASRRRSS